MFGFKWYKSQRERNRLADELREAKLRARVTRLDQRIADARARRRDEAGVGYAHPSTLVDPLNPASPVSAYGGHGHDTGHHCPPSDSGFSGYGGSSDSGTCGGGDGGGGGGGD